jgi:medium-chain acyl-[acyl-carrier-protein] hydrolase
LLRALSCRLSRSDRLNKDPNQPTSTAADPGVWREDVRIHSYDADFQLRASPEALSRAFLEVAWNHAEHLGVGHSDLARHGKLWVLGRLLLQIDLCPCWGDKVQICTWPRGISGVFALRDFEIFDENEARLVAGSSSWLVLDASTHRPQRINKLLQNLPTAVTRMALAREPNKLGPVTTPTNAVTREVRYSDVDVNRHVNSARYIGWLLDSYDVEFHRNHALHSLEVNYLAETLWPDLVSVKSQAQTTATFAHSIVNSSQEEVLRAELTWKAESNPSRQSPSSSSPSSKTIEEGDDL